MCICVSSFREKLFAFESRKIVIVCSAVEVKLNFEYISSSFKQKWCESTDGRYEIWY